MIQQILSATYSHLHADELALIISASPGWSSSEVVPPLQKHAQQVLNEIQIYAHRWKQPINYLKTEWQ